MFKTKGQTIGTREFYVYRQTLCADLATISLDKMIPTMSAGMMRIEYDWGCCFITRVLTGLVVNRMSVFIQIELTTFCTLPATNRYNHEALDNA